MLETETASAIDRAGINLELDGDLFKLQQLIASVRMTSSQ